MLASVAMNSYVNDAAKVRVVQRGMAERCDPLLGQILGDATSPHSTSTSSGTCFTRRSKCGMFWCLSQPRCYIGSAARCPDARLRGLATLPARGPVWGFRRQPPGSECCGARSRRIPGRPPCRQGASRRHVPNPPTGGIPSHVSPGARASCLDGGRATRLLRNLPPR